MKNYNLHKALVFKTGLVFGSNKYGHKWLEIRFQGRLVCEVTLVKTYNERISDLILQEVC